MTTHPYTFADLKTQRKAEPNLRSKACAEDNNNDNIRFRRGSDIVDKKNQIQELDKFQYRVKSQSSCREYEVHFTELGWICSCPDHRFRAVICKHIYAIEYTVKDAEKQDRRGTIEVNNLHVKEEKL